MAAHEPAGAFASALRGEALIAVGLVGPDGDSGEWRVRGMATAPQARGAAPAPQCSRHCSPVPAPRAPAHLVQRRTPARSLYERAGMRAVSDEFEIPPIGPHFVMELRTAPEPPPRTPDLR